MARLKHGSKSSSPGGSAKRSKGLLKAEEAFLQDVDASVMTDEERLRAEERDASAEFRQLEQVLLHITQPGSMPIGGLTVLYNFLVGRVMDVGTALREAKKRERTMTAEERVFIGEFDVFSPVFGWDIEAMRYITEVLLEVPEFRVMSVSDDGNVTGLRIKDFSPASDETAVRDIFRHVHFRGMVIRMYTGREGRDEEVHVFCVMTQCGCDPKYRQYFVYDGLPRSNGGVYPISSAGQGVEGLYRYFQHAGEHLRVEYPALGRMQSADGMFIPDELWNPVVGQFSGFPRGNPISEEGQMNLGMMRDFGTSDTGIGCLMPAVTPMLITRNRAGYVTDRLRVVGQEVGRPEGMFGGDSRTGFRYAQPGIARREMSSRHVTIEFRNADTGDNEEMG